MAVACDYQELFDFLPDGYLETDTDGIIRQATCAAAALFRVNRDLLIGQSLLEFVAGELGERQTFQNQLTQLPHLKRLQGWEVRLQPIEGPSFLVSLTVGIMVGTDSQLVGLRWLLHAITERQQAEEAHRNNIQELKLGYKQAIVYARELTAKITALKQAEAVMRKQRQELRRLSTQLINTQEAERKRLAHELHDEMGQAMTAIGLNLEVIEQELSPALSPTITKRLADTISLVDQTLAQIRELSLNLRPSMLDDLGLEATLSWYVKQYAARSTIAVELDAREFEGRLKAEVEIALYRVVQEALTNVARHAQAQGVYLRLVRQEAAVAILIEDDGRGFDIQEVNNRQASEPGLGLIGIRERVTALGGQLDVQSQPERGTRLFIEIPI